MTTAPRPLPPGVEIREFENGWHAYRLPTPERPWPEVLLHPGHGDDFAGDVEYWTKHQVSRRPTKADATAAFWKWHDEQPENQAKGTVILDDNPDAPAGDVAKLWSALASLTARVAALEGRREWIRPTIENVEPFVKPPAPPEPVVGVVYRMADAPGDARRWKWLGDGKVEFSWGDGKWSTRHHVTASEVADCIRTGDLVPVTKEEYD